jgi:hypothetical protein
MKMAGVGGGTGNRQSSLALAEAEALAKCRAFASSIRCEIIGRNGIIVARLGQTGVKGSEKPSTPADSKVVADAETEIQQQIGKDFKDLKDTMSQLQQRRTE